MFTIGGLSGVTHAFAPMDTQQTDTYYIVAHFHYVLFGGALFGLFSGIYFWWPKIFGYFLNEKLGKVHFWLMIIGFNLTFGPMHILGLQGMMRRTFTYTEGQGFNGWNLVATLGAYTLAVSILVFMWNAFRSYRTHRKNPVNPGPDPWDARSLEWMIPSPTPEHNFDEVPIVEDFDEFWHRKYGHDENGRPVRIAATEDVVQKGDATDVHLPSPSYWPLVLAAGFPLIGYGLIFNLWWALPGVILLIAGIYGWVLEPSTDPSAGHGHGDDHHHDDDDSDAASLDEPGADDPEDTSAEDSGPREGDRELEPAMASAAADSDDAAVSGVVEDGASS